MLDRINVSASSKGNAKPPERSSKYFTRHLIFHQEAVIGLQGINAIFVVIPSSIIFPDVDKSENSEFYELLYIYIEYH